MNKIMLSKVVRHKCLTKNLHIYFEYFPPIKYASRHCWLLCLPAHTHKQTAHTHTHTLFLRDMQYAYLKNNFDEGRRANVRSARVRANCALIFEQCLESTQANGTWFCVCVYGCVMFVFFWRVLRVGELGVVAVHAKEGIFKMFFFYKCMNILFKLHWEITIQNFATKTVNTFRNKCPTWPYIVALARRTSIVCFIYVFVSVCARL